MRPAAPKLATLLLVAALGGCGSTTPTPPASGPSGSHATTSPAASPQATAGPLFSFGAKAVVTTSLAGMPGANFINPGAVIEADGDLHMYPNLFSGWPDSVYVWYLVSKDGGETWGQEAAEPVLSSSEDSTPLTAPNVAVSTGYIAEDGTWVLVFEAISETTPWVLGRATAPGPRGPWTYDPEPILTPGPEGAFDDGGVQWPSVVWIGDQLTMFYTGVDDVYPGDSAIGMAVLEADGWVKRDEPVLTASEAWELGSVDRPRVVATPAGLVMVHSGLDLTYRGIATSVDGITWQKAPNPVIVWDQFQFLGGAFDAALLYRESQLVYFLEIGQSNKSTSVYRATLDWP